jgi:hypothetical protein
LQIDSRSKSAVVMYHTSGWRRLPVDVMQHVDQVAVRLRVQLVDDDEVRVEPVLRVGVGAQRLVDHAAGYSMLLNVA